MHAMHLISRKTHYFYEISIGGFVYMCRTSTTFVGFNPMVKECVRHYCANPSWVVVGLYRGGFIGVNYRFK